MGMLAKKKQRREAEIPTSSMADIAFLLLIFFLVTTTIDVDTGIGMTLPPELDEEIEPLDEYLGDMRFYLGAFFDRFPEGVEFVGAPQRWVIRAK